MSKTTAEQNALYNEWLGEAVFDAMMIEATNLTMTDLLMLRSAWKGKLRWEEMPDSLRMAFFRVGLAATNTNRP